MSGCADVCLDHGYDGYNVFYKERIVTARKLHHCVECGEEIRVGEKYELVNLKNEHGFQAIKTCAVCEEIRNAFICGTWAFGELWESIREGMFPVWETKGPLDCLAKLTTVAARDRCREEYADWKEDNDD